MTIEEEFKKVTGETDDISVSLFLDKAEETVARYERDGESGESSHSEGGVNRSYRSEDEILSGIDKYRLSAVARRRLNAKKKDEEIQT